MPVIHTNNPNWKGAPTGTVDGRRGGGDDGGMDDNERLRMLEKAVAGIGATLPHLATKADVEGVRTELANAKLSIITLLGGFTIATTLGLAGLMAKGFGWL